MTKHLTAPCEQCGNFDGVLNPEMGMHLCAACTFDNMDYDTARLHMVGLMREAMNAWALVWKFKPDIITSKADLTRAALEQLTEAAQ